MGRLEMTRKVFKWGMAAFVLLSSTAYAQRPGLTGYVKNNPDGSQTLLNHVPRSVALGLAAKIAHAAFSQMLDLRILLPSRDPAGLDNFVKELYDPKSPTYHKFLTLDQFNLMFGASSTDTSIVANYFRSKGFIVKKQSKNGFILNVTAPVSAVEPAFKVNINNYKGTDGKSFFASDADPTIPPQVAGKIYAIAGLDNTARFHPHFHRNTLLQPVSNSPLKTVSLNLTTSLILHFAGTNGAISSKVNIKPATQGFQGYGESLGPSDITAIYNLNSVSSNGSGQTLGLFELDGYTPGDITQFETYYSLPSMTLTNVCPTGDSCPESAGTNTDEDVLDIDLAIATAPGLSSIRVYEAPDTGAGWVDLWNTILDDPDRPNIVSVSWGAYEAGTYPDYDHSVFSELAALGVTLFASTGDAGAYDNCEGGFLPGQACPPGVSCGCNTPSAGQCVVNASTPPACTTTAGVASVDDPASDPNITGVGISAVTVNNPGTVDESYDTEAASLYGGGGISSYVSIPSYQTTAATNYYNATSGAYGSTGVRNVPDVVLTADPSTIYGIYVSDQSPPGWYAFWGSSAASPIWAAFMSRVNEGRVAAGQTVIGSLNAALYGVAQTRYSSDFHDISSGNNDYYPAKSGYDDATGLGSFNGANLYSDLIGPAAPTDLIATPGNAQVALSWNAVSGAASYNIERSITSGGETFLINVSSSPYTDSSVSNGQIYYYVVNAVNAGGIGGVDSSEVNATPEAVPPSPPTVVTAQPGNAQATVSFSGASGNGSTITGYTVTSSGAQFNTGSSSPVIVSALTNGTSYTFTVTATSNAGTSSPSSPSNSVVPGAPTAPTTVTATAGDGQASVAFSGASGNGNAITGYTVTSSGGQFNTGSSSPVIVSALTNGTSYTFTVTATNSIGTSPSSSASNSVIPAGLPTAPTTVTAVAGNMQATVTFSGATANGSAITSYTVTSSGGQFNTGSSSPIIVSGLTNGTLYTFTVTATNGVGTSSSSSASNGVTPAEPPSPPTTVSATGGNGQATITFSGALDNGSAITGYTVTSSGGQHNTGASSPIIVSGLVNGTSYTFTVTATNGIGTSSPSSATNSVIPAGPPFAPTTVTAVGGDMQATVTFSGASGNGSVITGYTVTSSPDSIQATGTSSPITVTGLTNGTLYTFTVTATNGLGTSSPSGASNSVTPSPVAPPSALSDTLLGARVGSQIIYGGVVLAWAQSTTPGIVQNNIYRSAGAGSYVLIATINAATSYKDTGVIKGTAYNYEVTAYDSNGNESTPSNSVTVNY